MTDNEIVKGLECCRNNAREDECKYCLSCPMAHCDLDEDEELNCLDAVYKRALDLINRQKAEIEKYRVNNNALKRAVEVLKKDLDNSNAEIERLTKANERFAEEFDAYYASVKCKAYKEFAERLCEGRVSNDPVVIAVKVELEEMTVNYESSKQRKDEGK